MSRRLKIYCLFPWIVSIFFCASGFAQSDLYWFTSDEVSKLYETALRYDRCVVMVSELEAQVQLMDSSCIIKDGIILDLQKANNNLNEVARLQYSQNQALEHIVSNLEHTVRQERVWKWTFLGTTGLAIFLGVLF